MALKRSHINVYATDTNEPKSATIASKNKILDNNKFEFRKAEKKVDKSIDIKAPKNIKLAQDSKIKKIVHRNSTVNSLSKQDDPIEETAPDE